MARSQPDIIGAVAELMAPLPLPVHEHAPCAECGECHGPETECFEHGAFATAPDRTFRMEHVA